MDEISYNLWLRVNPSPRLDDVEVGDTITVASYYQDTPFKCKVTSKNERMICSHGEQFSRQDGLAILTRSVPYYKVVGVER